MIPVVGKAVADDLDEGEALEDGRVLDDGLDDAGQQDVVGELGGFGEGQGHGADTSFIDCAIGLCERRVECLFYK